MKVRYNNIVLETQIVDRLIPMTIIFIFLIKKYNFNIFLEEIPTILIESSSYLQERLQIPTSELPEDFFQAWDKLNDEAWHLSLNNDEWAIRDTIRNIVEKWSPYLDVYSFE